MVKYFLFIKHINGEWSYSSYKTKQAAINYVKHMKDNILKYKLIKLD